MSKFKNTVSKRHTDTDIPLASTVTLVSELEGALVNTQSAKESQNRNKEAVRSPLDPLLVKVVVPANYFLSAQVVSQ